MLICYILVTLNFHIDPVQGQCYTNQGKRTMNYSYTNKFYLIIQEFNSKILPAY